MKINHLHGWDLSYEKAREIQLRLRERLILRSQDIPLTIQTIAGADISYAKSTNTFFAAVVLFDFETMEIIEQASSSGVADFPYIPGLLTFREGPILLEAFRKLTYSPDIIIFAGQGIAHPRGIGLASHMGLFLDAPSIGCGKTRLVGSYDEPGNDVGDYSPLFFKAKITGAVLRTKKNVKPVFISPGHKIGCEKAIAVALASCRGYRLPEPTRRAHLAAGEIRLLHEHQSPPATASP